MVDTCMNEIVPIKSRTVTTVFSMFLFCSALLRKIVGEMRLPAVVT